MVGNEEKRVNSNKIINNKKNNIIKNMSPSKTHTHKKKNRQKKRQRKKNIYIKISKIEREEIREIDYTVKFI